MANKKNESNLPVAIQELPTNPILAASGFDIEEIGAEGLMQINELFMSLTQKPDNYHGDDIQWQMASLRLVQGLTTRDGIDVPQGAKNGDIVAAGEVLFDSDDGKKAGLKCVCAHMCKTYTYYPEQGSDEAIRTVFEKTYNEAIPAHEKEWDNSPGGFKTRWRVGYDYVIIPLDMSGIFKVRFVKSSGKAGRALQRKVATWGALYQFPIGLYSKEESADIGNQKVTFSVFDFTLEATTEVPAAVKALAKIVGTAYDAHYLQAVEDDVARERALRSNASVAASNAPVIDITADEGGFDDDV